MNHRGGIAFYVTSHGFGHLNRSVAVINLIPRDVPVTIRGDPSLFDHWGERLKRPAILEPHTSDVGALNPPGDSAATDGPGTLAKAAEVHARAMKLVDDEAAKLRDEGTLAVLCDATPIPLVAARRAGVPGFLLANFTWADIYLPHARKLGPEAGQTVREIRSAYRHATALFRAEPALKMAGYAPTTEVGMVVTPGVDRRQELRAKLGLSPEDKLVYFYIGRYGQANLGWERLARLEHIHFVGFHPAPSGSMANLHVVPRDRVDRCRPGGLERRDRRQGRLWHHLRGDGRRGSLHLSSTDRIRRAPGPRPRLEGLGRRHPGLGPRIRRPEAGTPPRTSLHPPARPSPLPLGWRFSSGLGICWKQSGKSKN